MRIDKEILVETLIHIKPPTKTATSLCACMWALQRDFSCHCKSRMFTLLFWLRWKIDPVTLHHGIHVLIS